MKRTLVIEAGATKTEWAVSGKEVMRFRTAGINCSVMPLEAIVNVVAEAEEYLRDISEDITEIRFYGAGLVAGESIIVLDKEFKSVFPNAVIAYGSDLLAAARAAWGRNKGIVAILGTGSNSGFYDGSTIVENIRSGGFILGDEGGGASLGKALIADHIKGLLPKELERRLSEIYDVSYETIVRNVYRGKNAAGSLASFAPFVLENRDIEGVDAMIEYNLRNFVRRVLLRYDVGSYDVAVVGSFGCACREDLVRIGKEYGVRFAEFIKSPVEVLVKEW